MAHNVEQMFSVRQVPWHKLGRIVQEAPTAAEAIKLAGLDWQVLSKQAYAYLGIEGAEYSRIDNHQALIRSDNNKILSVMKESYHPLQNQHAFDFFNPFVESGLASFETAGSLREGKVIWVLATLNKAPIDVGGGDVVMKHLLLSNSHDGSMAVRVGFTPTRVVCNNTLTAAHTHGDSKLLRIRHSSTVKSRLDDIRDIVNAMDAKFEATAAQYRKLAASSVNTEDVERYVNIVFELNPNGNEREQMRYKKVQENITKLFENGAGAHLKSAKGTAWGLYNAVTEHLTHESNANEESRLYGNWFGGAAAKNQEAFEAAMELA